MMMPVRTQRPKTQTVKGIYLIPVMLMCGAALVAQMMWLQKNDYMFRPFSIEKISCDECGGTGVVHDRKDDDILHLCPSCFGVGSRMVRRVDAEDKMCPACQGMGRLQDRDTHEWRMCRRCGSRGLVRDAPWASTAGSFTNSP